MLKNTKFRLIPLIVAILMQILAIGCDQTSTNNQQPSKVSRQTSAQPNETKRPSPAARAAAGSTKGRQIKVAAGRKTIDPTKKFQARMMNEADQAAPQQQQQQQQSASIKRQDVGPDSWQAHPLVPTFTDQEQGDEMVALASDQHESEEIRMLPPANSSVPMRSPNSRSKLTEQTNHSSHSDKVADAAHKAARLNLQDEYEGDDDDDLDDEPARYTPGAGEYELATGRASKEAQASQSEKFKPLQPSALEYTDYTVPHYEQVNKARHVAAANRSATNLVRAADKGWLPAASSQTSQNEAQFQPITQAQPEVQAPPQRKPKSDNKSPETVHRERPSSVSGRLAGLFGGREGFNKADAAIEYLRNMLKSKQSQLDNSTQTSNEPAGGSFESKPERGSSYDRISLLTSRLNKILNATSVQSSNSTSSGQAKLPGPTPLRVLDSRHQIQPASQMFVATDLMGGRARQAGSKFSISDAKSISQMESAQRQSTQQQMPLLSMPSTRQPNEQSYSSEPTLNEPAASQPTRAGDANSPAYTDHIAAQMPANGTPLGGDYIEGLDDYPRYTQEPHQHPGSTLQESQSQLVPIRQESPKAEQYAQNPPSRVAPVEVDSSYHHHQLQQHHQQPQQQQHEQQQQQPEQHHQQHQPQQQQQQQQQQPSDLAEGVLNLHQQQHQAPHEGPKSSRYFHMHQVPPHDEPRLPIEERPELFVKKDERKPYHAETRDHRNPGNQDVPQEPIGHDASPSSPPKYSETLERAPLRIPQKPVQHETSAAHQVYQDPINRPPANLQQQPAISSSKIYGSGKSHPTPVDTSKPGNQAVEEAPRVAPNYPTMPNKVDEQQQQQNQHQPAKAKPPKIVSYNYFESPSENGKESELMATNYQLADALYSSTGELGHMLSNTELEAIQSQFLTAEHPIVPIPAGDLQPQAEYNPQNADQSLAGLLSNLKPEDYPPEALQKLISPAKHAEETLRELASNDQPMSALPPPTPVARPPIGQAQNAGQRGDELRKLLGKPLQEKKQKSLIVYLNHPRPVDMSKSSSTNGDGYNLAQSVSDQPLESFISAKEFDTQGLSKDTKHLDVSSLRGFGDSKENPDKDGLSVVVIGDAYKYKKIVLLISSKSGGLKFIPMVKDMKR